MSKQIKDVRYMAGKKERRDPHGSGIVRLAMSAIVLWTIIGAVIALLHYMN